ncbi:MAG: hypothetical protein ABI555_06365 [Chloroflexota bacterium]
MGMSKVLRGVGVGLAGIVLAGCSTIFQASPEPTPMDFPGMAGELAGRGLVLDHIASGDAGCTDPTLIPTAIGFDASGLGVTTPVHLRVYIFRTGETFDRRRPDIDPCVAQWAQDPATVELIDAKPYVLAGQGPWPAAFKDAIRAALMAAAGNGG